MGLLNKTKTYLIGHMEYINGESWRQYVTEELNKLGIICYNPYKKPFIEPLEEGENVRAELKEQIKLGNFEYVNTVMRKIRIFDLNLVDKSDYIIAHIKPEIASWGTAEELTTANKCKRPIFCSIDGGKKNTPLWLLGMLPHKYFYDSIDDILEMLRNIDSGKAKTDSNRWRLLREELR